MVPEAGRALEPETPPRGTNSPFFTAPEAAAYLRMEHADGTPNVSALYQARWRHGIRAHRRGRKLLFKRADLDAFLSREMSVPEVLADQRRPIRLASLHGSKVGARRA
jgi:hypothetical protein